jgi:hypothetical protein
MIKPRDSTALMPKPRLKNSVPLIPKPNAEYDSKPA